MERVHVPPAATNRTQENRGELGRRLGRGEFDFTRAVRRGVTSVSTQGQGVDNGSVTEVTDG